MNNNHRHGAAPRWIVKDNQRQTVSAQVPFAPRSVASDDSEFANLLEEARQDDLVVISAGDLKRFRSESQLSRKDSVGADRPRGNELRIFFQALEQSPSIVVIADVHGRVEYVNPEFCRVSGLEVDQVLGSSLASIGNPPGELAAQIFEAIDNEADWQGDLPCEKNNGEIYWEMATISPLRDERGRVTHFLKVAEDISPRKEVEAKLEAARRSAEAASGAKSLFLGGMTHELRTPLHAIIGFSEVLIEEAFGPLSGKQAKYARNILDSGRDLLNLIDQVLDLSKVESGQVELELSQLDLESLLRDEAEDAKSRLSETKAQIQVEIDESLRPAHIVADEDRMRQIVHNLCVSAMKLAGDSGKITVRARRRGDEVVVCVHHDVVVGIAPSELARVFEDLERVFDPTQVDSVGAGMALALAKRLVVLHGGHVWAETELERGASLCFSVPAAPVQKAARYPTLGASRAPVAPVFSDLTGPVGGTVLVVQHEDHRSVLLRRYLEDADHVLSHAYDAKQALEMARRYNPDIVVIDLVRAGVEAWDVTMSLREHPATRHIPILEVSENEQGDLRVTEPLVEIFKKTSDEALLRGAVGREVSRCKESPARVLFVDQDEEDTRPILEFLERRKAHGQVATTGQAAVAAAAELKPHVFIVNPNIPDMIVEDFIGELGLNAPKGVGRLFVYSSKPVTVPLKRVLGRLTRDVELHESGKKNLLAALDEMLSCRIKEMS